jgi:hypothetical protein
MALPTGEIGYATEGYTGTGDPQAFWQTAEETPELIWPLSVRVFRKMARQDAQCTSVEKAVTLPIRRTAWRIDPAGARDEVTQHIATDLGLPIKGAGDEVAARRKGRFSWSEHLVAALRCLRYGHSFFEQSYSVDDAGLFHLHRLGERPADTISEIKVDRDGGLYSITQFGMGTGARVLEIPVNRLVAYVNEREGGDWTGVSLLRPAYKHWLIRDRLLRVQAQTIERNGMGVPVYIAGPEDGPEEIAAGKRIAQSYKSGSPAAPRSRMTHCSSCWASRATFRRRNRRSTTTTRRSAGRFSRTF